MPETEIIFSKKTNKKKNSKCEILIHLCFGPNFIFQGTAIARFSFVSPPSPAPITKLPNTFLDSSISNDDKKQQGVH